MYIQGLNDNILFSFSLKHDTSTTTLFELIYLFGFHFRDLTLDDCTHLSNE